jgi:uncharacterized protein (TIGR02996 family)
MNTSEYWRWIEAIWNKKTDATIRLVFADWLDEQGRFKAAAKQRGYADLVNRAVEIEYMPRISQCYVIVGGFKHKLCRYRMKQNGHLYHQPRQIHLFENLYQPVVILLRK